MNGRDSIWWRGFWDQILRGGEMMVNVRLFDMRLQDMLADLETAEKRATSPGDDGLRADALHQIEMGMEDWKAHGHRARASFAERILAALARKEGEG